MDKYVETLDALMKAKKEKKRPTIKEKEALLRIQVWSVAPNSICTKDLLSAVQSLSMPI